MREYFTSFKDNCGFGLLASIDNVATHRNLDDAVTALSRMMHRGAIAADGKTGDGSGLLLSIPKRFFGNEAKREGVILPEQYAVAMVFHRDDKEINVIKDVCQNNDLRVCFERDVPIDTNALGEQALVTLPKITQLFCYSKLFNGSKKI